MKNHYLTLLFLFSVCLGFAQTKDSLSVEEQARREKNIQAGNPFKKFGYNPKIATLSKGKYLEFHDLDSIVQVGTFMYNTRSKSIASIIERDTLPLSEATLKPETVSRWMNPDPLAEEFPSWSPYNFVYNNPIFFIDPTGLAPESVDGDDIYIYLDKDKNISRIEIVNTGETTPNRLFVQDIDATADTENRLDKDGSYFEMQIIPSSEYTEEDYKAQGWFGSSQFDKDRNSYITVDGGEYSDKNWFQRVGESISDDPITISDLQSVFSRKGGSITTLGARKGERGQTSKPSGTDSPYKKMKPDPSNPKRVIMKDANGKSKSVAKPEGFDAYWSKKGN